VSRGVFARLRQLFGNGAAPADEERPYRVRLVVGLGNPGKEYAGNRHNVGYWTVNRLARRHGIELAIRGKTALGEGRIEGRQVALAKPRTFVNASGPAVWNLIKQLKLDDASELLVVCDELDLPVGKLRLRPKGGHGGYRGLQSIIDSVGTDRFPRLRIGIGRPIVNGQPSYEPDIVAAYVLSDPPPEERRLLDEAVERAIHAIDLAVTEGLEPAMKAVNQPGR